MIFNLKKRKFFDVTQTDKESFLMGIKKVSEKLLPSDNDTILVNSLLKGIIFCLAWRITRIGLL